MKKVLATVLLIATFAVLFSVPGYAINVYWDKTADYSPSDKLSVHSTVEEWDGTGEYGEYPTRKGTILVTHDALFGGLVGHAAIVYSSTQIIHAAPQGVIIDKNNWRTVREGGFVGLAVRDTDVKTDALVAEWCKEQVGASYCLLPFMWKERDVFYCSHLVYCGYKDIAGVDLNTKVPWYPGLVAPYELIRSPETYLIYAKNWSRK